MSLPGDLITKVKPLILPYVRDKDEREALFIETYFLRDPRPLDQISFEGSAEVFTVRCIADLVKKIGCLAEEGERQHSLSALLMTVRSRCGVEKHPDIDYWLPILNDECSVPSVEPPPVEPVNTSPQTVETPIQERTASVFISYSHADEAFAKDLIAELGKAGHTCWIDTSKIKGGADWKRAICDGINLSYALVVVCTRKSLESDYVWDEIQWARVRRKLIIPVLLEDVTDDDRFFGLHRYQGIRFDKLAFPQATTALIAALPTPPSGDTPPRPLTQRELELAYLDRLRFDDFRLERFELAEYASLAGEAQTRREVRDSWEALAMQQEFTAIPIRIEEALEQDAPPEKFTDAVSKITELRRVVVLGEPGAGKTHTLRAIAKPLYTAALSDPAAPIPLMIKLGNWDKLDQPFETFVSGALGELGAHLDDLFAAKRAILLLDGLNEFPADQRAAKYPQVEAFIKAHPEVMAIVTCRETDYPISLHLSRVMIRPLDPLRIRDFARRALRSDEKGTTFFWKLAGTKAKEIEEEFRTRYGAELPNWETLFWAQSPRSGGAFPDYEAWLWLVNWFSLRQDPASLLTLARNPYMLRMLLDVYIQFKGQLPANRGQLFDQFVNVLLAREKLAKIQQETNTVTLTEEGRALLGGLQRIAYEMQIRRADKDSTAGTSLDRDAVNCILNDRLLYLAVSTSILTSGDEVRFSHQLLQEYFAARYMDTEIKAGWLQAATIWKPENWWERTNWEEAAILLAGLYSDDCTPVLNWLADANPEVTVQCILRSGATTPDATKRRLRDQWLSRAFHPSPRLRGRRGKAANADANPLARAAVGRALGLFTIDDLPADNRKGVSVIVLNGVTLPDIDWVSIPAGEFIYQKDQRITLPAFQMSRYLITYKQFQTFIDAADGWSNPAWWEGLYHKAQPSDQAFKFSNHPREGVSWYDAIAFTHWLSAKLGYTVMLPTEQQYERAAGWTDGRMYPYEGEFEASKGNTTETGIGQTSAVGVFLDGTSVEGIHDLSGNVWEWCLNEYSEPKNISYSGANTRVVRGGSWNGLLGDARCARRYYGDPVYHGSGQGFRLARS